MSETGISAEMIDRLVGARVVVIGDVMLDRYVYGRAERLSPEAPVPVLHVAEQTAMLGGAGNVARTLSALGVEARFISAVGEDTRGEEIATLCAGLPGIGATLVPTPGRQTSLKTRFIAGGQQLLRADEEDHGPVGDTVADAVADAAQQALGEAGALILSDYGKGLLTPALLHRLIEAARAAGVPVLVDPKGTDYTRYRGADLVTPNRAELALASGMPVDGDAATEAAARALAAQAGIAAVLATRGRDGMMLLSPDGSVEHVAAEALEVFDVSGAGDTVIGTAAAAIAAGLPLPVAMRLANAAAGVVVGKIGTAVARPGEIAAALERTGETGAFFDRARAVEQAAAWRARGLSVGFANGCFDLLHPGHIHLLRQARAACDRLIVALNTDASVRRLKGPDRPVRGETDRASVIAALDMVDLVTLFDEDTPEALIEALRPDVLVKGADYTRDQVVGGAFVESYGGRVLLAELLADHSTTATIDRLKNSGD